MLNILGEEMIDNFQKGVALKTPSTKSILQNELIASSLSHIKYKILVMSGKGGVGKSSVAVNFAAALSAMGKKVGILDVDVHGPSAPRLLGLTGQLSTVKGSFMEPKKYNENLSMVSVDFLLEDTNSSIMWRGPRKTAAIRQFISDVEWGELDFLIIDAPPGTGDEPLSVIQAIPDLMSIIVTTPQELSLADVRKAIHFLQHVKTPIVGLVENMSGLICPNCSTEINLFKKGGGEKLAKEYNISFLGAIPLDPITVVAGDLGKPVVLMEEETEVKKAFLSFTKEALVRIESYKE